MDTLTDAEIRAELRKALLLANLCERLGEVDAWKAHAATARALTRYLAER